MATLKFVQAQKFSLAGSGASIGDTTITLQSMLGIDGVAIVTADIGTGGFGTLEPGNGVQEEAIKFTGITQNANGTATLTGVSHVLFISPYTASSGLTKTHAGASTFILSNDAAFYGAILDYVDNSLMASGIPATNLVAGISKLSVAATSASNPIAVGDNDPRLLASGTTLYINSIQNTGIPYAVATGTALAYTATLASSISSLASGTFLNFLVPISNATGVTLNVNSLGAKSITKLGTTALASGDVLMGQVAQVVYDGTRFQLTDPQPLTPIFSNGTFSKNLSEASTTNTVAHGLLRTPTRVYVSGLSAGNNWHSVSNGTYTLAGQNGIYSAYIGASGSTGANSLSGSVVRLDNTSGAQTGAISSITATGITFSWTKSGSTSGDMYVFWETQA